MSSDGNVSSEGFEAFGSAFFQAYLTKHPEEGTTLGWMQGAAELRQHSSEALADERALYSQTQKQLSEFQDASLSLDQRLDKRMLTRVVEHHLHLGDALWQGVDWSMYPCTMLQMQLAHAQVADDFAPVVSRLTQVERFLVQHQRNVERSFAGSRPPDAMLAQYFVDVQLPAAAHYFRSEVLPLATAQGCSEALCGALKQACAQAADAYDEHCRWLKQHALPNAVDDYRLGEPEVAWRLKHTFGIERSASQLVALAENKLAEVQALFIATARRVAPTVDGASAEINSLADARILAMDMQAMHIASAEAIAPLYQGYIDKARQLAADKQLFHIPGDYRLGIVSLPAGLNHAGHAGNWPAPLLDRNKLGHFAVSPDPKAHSLAWAADLAIHEGFPGHHLQSLCWQRHFGTSAAPLRFLLVHDQVAIPRNYWGAMLNIEGYAVYAEELMRQHGFFTPREELFVLLAHAVRAARVVVDLQLHSGAMSPDEAQIYLQEQVCLPENTAKMEVRRYMQIPLQASSYLLGWLGIEALKRDVRSQLGTAFDEADFHEQFFSYGPVDPDTIKGCMLSALADQRR